jgi:hypothetical protein
MKARWAFMLSRRIKKCPTVRKSALVAFSVAFNAGRSEIEIKGYNPERVDNRLAVSLRLVVRKP